jgi:hypothetical protein
MDLNINYEKKYIKYKKKYLKLKEELEGGKGGTKAKTHSPKSKAQSSKPKEKSKTQSSKPKEKSKAQSPKPKEKSKAQSAKPKEKKEREEIHFNYMDDGIVDNIVENVALARDTKTQALKRLFIENNINVSDNFYTKINDRKDINDIIEEVSNDPELKEYPNIKEIINLNKAMFT